MSIDAEDMAELARYGEVLREHLSLVRTALWGQLERMEKAAGEAQAAYDAGQADPEVKAQQDASMVANLGYKHMAELFRESAKSARKALDDLMNAELGPEESQD